jgi:NitT/TauT family transport system permease protein
MSSRRAWRFIAPAVVGLLFLGLWETVVRANGIPAYILPAPSAVAFSLWTDGPSLRR